MELWRTDPFSFYHADGNGNITGLINAGQTALARYVYDPFGYTLSMGGPSANVNLYRFSSKEAHLYSGLLYYSYRFYDPSTQRWPNRDPLSERGFEALRQSSGNPNGAAAPNLYTFVQNNAISAFDPLGLMDFGSDMNECLRNCDSDRMRRIARGSQIGRRVKGHLGFLPIDGAGGALCSTVAGLPAGVPVLGCGIVGHIWWECRIAKQETKNDNFVKDAFRSCCHNCGLKYPLDAELAEQHFHDLYPKEPYSR